MSETKLISLNKGIYRTSFGNDGELEECVNLIPENGQLKPVQNPSALDGIVMEDVVLYEGTEGEQTFTDILMYVHENGTFTHYIAKTCYGSNDEEYEVEEYLTFYADGGKHLDLWKWQINPGVTINQITHVGNTLIVLTSEGIERFLWKDGTYMALGNDFPELDIQFGLEGEIVSTVKTDLVELVNQRKTSEDDYTFETVEAFDEDASHNPIVIQGDKGDTRNYTFNINIAAATVYRITLIEQNPRITIKMYTSLSNSRAYVSEGKRPSIVIKTDTPATSLTVYLETTGSFQAVHDRNYRCTLLVEKSTSNESSILKHDLGNYNAIMGAVREFVSEKVNALNKFVYPFFIRYSYKLYDGTYTKPSVPCLMIPTTGQAPLLGIIAETSSASGEETYGSVILDAIVCKLMYKIKHSSNLDAWSDIIKGISFAITQPVYTYDSSKEFNLEREYFKLSIHKDTTGHQSQNGINRPASTGTVGEENLSDAFGENGEFLIEPVNNAGSSTITRDIYMPQKKTADLYEELARSGNFYIIKEMNLDEYEEARTRTSTDFQELEMKDGTIETLVGRSRMSDGYMSLNKLIANNAFQYNHRLNIANYTEQKFKGYPVALMQGYVSGTDDVSIIADVELIENGISQSVRCNIHYDNLNPMIWFYYPSIYAKSATLYKTVTETAEGEEVITYYTATMLLDVSEVLTGSYWIGNKEDIVWEEIESIPTAPATAEYSYPNRIMQTKVDNPFAWEEKVSSVASDKILAICAVTKPLSQNMFGQNPLVAFTNDGIWGLTVNADGTYGAPQSINRDIVTNTKCIIQTDEAIIYATDQGLKITTGQVGEGKELCPQMRGVQRLSLSDVVGDTEVTSQPWGNSAAAGSLSVTRIFNDFIVEDDTLFVDMLRECTGCYDYSHKLLHLYPDADVTPYSHWAVSTETGEAIMICNDYIEHMYGTRYRQYDKPRAIVNGYPSSYIQQRNEIMVYNQEYQHYYNNFQMKIGMLLTRPIAFGDATAMKMLEDMRSVMDKSQWSYRTRAGAGVGTSRARAIVMVSNDGVKWYRLKSLRSHSWKWYRFALFTEMTDKDTLQGIVCQVSERRKNKLR